MAVIWFLVSNYFFWIPIIGPISGAITGSLLYIVLVGGHLSPQKVISNRISQITIDGQEIDEKLKDNENFWYLLYGNFTNSIKIAKNSFDRNSFVKSKFNIKIRVKGKWGLAENSKSIGLACVQTFKYI